jgi:hypothetical protein
MGPPQQKIFSGNGIGARFPVSSRGWPNIPPGSAASLDQEQHEVDLGAHTLVEGPALEVGRAVGLVLDDFHAERASSLGHLREHLAQSRELTARHALEREQAARVGHVGALELPSPRASSVEALTVTDVGAADR